MSYDYPKLRSQDFLSLS